MPRRLFPIFRDREELPLSSDLGATIQDALHASRYLIVLSSPNAAKSRWVNEEVRYFKSLGREDRIIAIMLDGDPNASDDPATAEQECFPPALRYRVDAEGNMTGTRTEPIAGDIRPGGDGWTSAFLKAVAGITGLGFDAFARRERKRQRRRRAIAAVAAMLMLSAGGWAWDYNRLKVSYYANLSSQWSVPVGVGQLDASTRAGRETHYRIESRQYKVRQVLRVNSTGQLREDNNNHDAAIHQESYREDGSVQQIDLRDRNDRLVMRQNLTVLNHTGTGPYQFLEFRQEQRDAPLAQPTTLGGLEIVLRVRKVGAPKSPVTSFTMMSWAESSARYTSISIESAEPKPKGFLVRVSFIKAITSCLLVFSIWALTASCRPVAAAS